MREAKKKRREGGRMGGRYKGEKGVEGGRRVEKGAEGRRKDEKDRKRGGGEKDRR